MANRGYASLSQLRSMGFEEMRQNMISGTETLLLPRINARREIMQNSRRYAPISVTNLPFYSTDEIRNTTSDEDATSYEEYLELDEDNMRRGVPSSVLSSLPVIRATTSHTSTKCAICQDDIAKGKNIMKLPCQHYYCYECITQWLKRSRNCPTCRSEV